MKSFAYLLLSVLFLANTACADEAGIKSEMAKKFPYQKIISVSKTPYLDLYEVVFEDQLVYTDEKMSYLFSGNVIDLKTMKNLTEARERQIYTVKFDTLPLHLALKKVLGNGTRRVAVFTDPNCPYCKKLEKEMVNLSNATVYLFPIAILPGSEEKARAIWCSTDRLKAWEDHMLSGVAPVAAVPCDTSVLKEFSKLAKSLRVYVTPTLIFEDGFSKAGWMELNLLEQQLSDSSAK